MYRGSEDGLGETASWTAEGDQAMSRYGYSVGTAGDANDDGYDDVIVGAPYYDNGEKNEGRAYVYYGASDYVTVTRSITYILRLRSGQALRPPGPADRRRLLHRPVLRVCV